ncbi:hypothetical protein ACIOGT_31025 [Streptomyces microflavus]|uniref:hypothetical protein n=1 Tax=Streptomyces microflavus TaxID=1919 RepID=UPI003815C112
MSRDPGGVPQCVQAPPRRLSGLEFTALVQMNGRFYLRYALARVVNQGAAAATVNSTLTETASRWPALLQGPQPAAAVWLRLRLNVEEAARHAACRDPLVDNLYGTLSSRVADAVVLNRKLQLSVDTTAGLMGVERSAIAAALLTAKRSLPSAFDDPEEE